MQTFYVTFGQKSPAKNGWIEVKADDEEKARAIVIAEYGQEWGFLYTDETFDPSYFPAGKLGVLH